MASTSHPLAPPTRAVVPIGSTRAAGSARRAPPPSPPSAAARNSIQRGSSASQYTASLPITNAGSSNSRPPAIPTWRTAAGRSGAAASAAAVRAAASTGPTPQTSVREPSAPRSSSAVAATPRITRSPYPAVRLLRSACRAVGAQTMSVTLEHDRATVALNGEHEAYSADKLARNLTALIAEGVPVTVDLRHATFIDSTVVGVLIAAHRRAAESGLEFVLLLGSETGWPVRRLLEVTGLDAEVAVYE